MYNRCVIQHVNIIKRDNTVVKVAFNEIILTTKCINFIFQQISPQHEFFVVAQETKYTCDITIQVYYVRRILFRVEFKNVVQTWKTRGRGWLCGRGAALYFSLKKFFGGFPNVRFLKIFFYHTNHVTFAGFVAFQVGRASDSGRLGVYCATRHDTLGSRLRGDPARVILLLQP